MNKKVGSYWFVSTDCAMLFKNGRRFRILLYGAYFSKGVLNGANNGIAVLDEDLKAIVCDGIAMDKMTLLEPTKYQKEALEMILNWSWADFVRHLNSNPRSRGPIVEELRPQTLQ